MTLITYMFGIVIKSSCFLTKQDDFPHFFFSCAKKLVSFETGLISSELRPQKIFKSHSPMYRQPENGRNLRPPEMRHQNQSEGWVREMMD